MKRLIIFFSLFASIFLTGCMSTTQSQENSRGLTSQNSAKVYVIRPSALFAAGLNFPVYVNGQNIGRIGEKGHLSWIVPPGQTTVTSTKGLTLIEFDRHLKHYVTFNAQAGKIYFVRLTIPWGYGLEPSPEFLMLNNQTGRALLKKVSSNN